jgi:protein-S-isoprenylcysteine O-methyltransferase Ste14
LTIVILFIGLRIHQFDQFPQVYSAALKFYGAFKTHSGEPVYSTSAILVIWMVKLAVWLIETGIFMGYIAAYASRVRAISVADGFMEVAFPVIVAGIPVLISLAPYILPRWAPLDSPFHMYAYLIVMGLILVGGLINLIGLLTLRRAFTIMTEARALVTRGIFSHIRHPLYTGHFIMFFGSLLLRLHGYTIIMYLLFAAGQVIRARMEERKLTQVFPEYAEYIKGTGMFWPKILR